MLPPLTLIVGDALNTGADNLFPHFASTMGQLQVTILKNPQLLIYYVGVCQHIVLL
jgi:hypothetical protein